MIEKLGNDQPTKEHVYRELADKINDLINYVSILEDRIYSLETKDIK